MIRETCCCWLLVLLAASCSANPWPNGWGSGGGGGGGGSPAPIQQGYNPAASGGGGNNDYWWMKENPFQKPANHPGVDKTAGVANNAPKPSYGGGSAQYVAPKPSYGSISAPQVQPPQFSGGGGGNYGSISAPQVQPPVSSSGGNYGSISAPQVQPARPSYGGSQQPSNGNGWNGPSPAASVPRPTQGYKPPSINFECMLTNKADCHSGGPDPTFSNQVVQVSPPRPSYAQAAPVQVVPSYGNPAPKPEKIQAPAAPPSYNQPSGGGSYAPKPAPVPSIPKQPSYGGGSYQPAPQPIKNNVIEFVPPKPAAASNSYNQVAVAAAAAGWGAPSSSSYGQNAAQPAPAPAPVPSYQPAPAPVPSYQPAPAPVQTYQPAPAPAPVPSYQPAPVPPPAPVRQPAYQPAPPQHNHNMPGNWVGDPGPHPPYPGCAAALLCVPDNQCDAKGVAQASPLNLSEAEKTYRVAVTACTNTENGAIGVCCRDPNYKDPWPDMNGGGGGGGHHHHPDPAPQQSGNSYDVAAKQRFSNTPSPTLFTDCQENNSICVESQRCENYDGQQGGGRPVQPNNVKKCRQDSPDGIDYVCCPVERTKSVDELDVPTGRKVPDAPFSVQNQGGDSGSANSDDVNRVASAPLSVTDNDSSNNYQASAAPVAQMATNNGQATYEDTKQQQLLIYHSSNSHIETTTTAPSQSASVPMATPSVRMSLPNFGNSAFVTTTEAFPVTVPTIAPSETATTRKPRQRIRIKLVSKIGSDQPNIVSLADNGSQFNSNYGATPGQSAVGAQNDYTEDQVETSSIITDDQQTVITRPSQRVTITDIRFPKELPFNSASDSSPATNQISNQPAINYDSQQYKNRQNPSSIFQEAPLVFEIHQGPGGSTQTNFPRTETTPVAVKIQPTTASNTQETPRAPSTTRKDQFHLYPFFPLVNSNNANRESIMTEDGETVYVPSQTYELPQLTPEEKLRFILPPFLNSARNTYGDQNDGVTFFSSLAQTSEDYVDDCPENMKCLTEAYCSTQDPAEGNSKDFDIRLSKKSTSTRKRCRQPLLPVDGYCCYLREDFEKVSGQGDSSPVTDDRKAVRNNRTSSCGIRRPPVIPEQDESESTAFGEFPWQALIFLNGRPSCGGVVLSERIVATSASCINVVRLEEVTVRVGEWDVSNLEEVKPHQDLDVKEFLPHPGYKPGAAADDYALLITKKRINFDYHVSPVCLPNPIDRFEGQRCIATGWDISVTSTGAPALEPRLKKSSLSIIGNSECQRRLTSSDSTIKLARNTICTAKEANGSCLVDRGGPLVCENPSTGSYTLAGVSSSGGVCQASQVITVYTNIRSYVEWTYSILQRPLPAEATESSSELKF